MEENTIGVASAISGALIRVTYRQWAHILENHDYSGSHSDKGQVNYSSLLISMAS
jgi:hypothetical protein